MLQYDIEHGSDEWRKIRIGKATSSHFDKILTPKTMEFSSQAVKYAKQKVLEIMTGEPSDNDVETKPMLRGKLMEAEAVAAYEMLYDVRLQKAGFLTDDKGRYGCSPDAESLDGDRICYEIKCYEDLHHLEYLLDPNKETEHKPQIQGHLLIGEYDYGVNFLYHPYLPSHRIVIERDEKFIKKLQAGLEKFSNQMNDFIEILQANGVWRIPQIPQNEQFDANKYLRNAKPQAANYLGAG